MQGRNRQLGGYALAHGAVKMFLMSKPKFIADRKELEKTAPVIVSPIKRHVFVCNGKSCAAVGSAEVKTEFAGRTRVKGTAAGKRDKRPQSDG